jgi:uncharacterized integral membrane protein
MTNMRRAIPPRRTASSSLSDTLPVGAVRMKRLILPTPRPSDVSEQFGGRWFVVALYGVVVAITGVVGAVLGAVGPESLTSVELLGLVELQPTPLGLAIYGVVTVGLILGVLLGLVAYVSRRFDAEQAE